MVDEIRGLQLGLGNANRADHGDASEEKSRAKHRDAPPFQDIRKKTHPCSLEKLESCSLDNPESPPSGLDPTAGTCDGSRPTAVGLLAARGAPLRLEGPVLTPEAREFGTGGVATARGTGGLGSAEGRGLAGGGADGGDAEDVGLERPE